MSVVPGEQVVDQVDRSEGQLHGVAGIFVRDQMFVQVQLRTLSVRRREREIGQSADQSDCLLLAKIRTLAQLALREN